MSWADFLYYNSKENKLYAVDEYNYGRIVTFNLNADGSVASDEVFTIESNSGTPVFIENSSLFVVNTNGQIKILDMNTKMYHTTNLTAMPYYSQAMMDSNNIYLHADNKTIYKISTPDYKIAQTIALRVVPTQIFVANGYLYYLGQYGNNAWLLDKIKL